MKGAAKAALSRERYQYGLRFLAFFFPPPPGLIGGKFGPFLVFLLMIVSYGMSGQ